MRCAPSAPLLIRLGVGLLIPFLVALLVAFLQLEVFLVGIALLAGLALLMCGHAALVLALLVGGGGPCNPGSPRPLLQRRNTQAEKKSNQLAENQRTLT